MQNKKFYFVMTCAMMAGESFQVWVFKRKFSGVGNVNKNISDEAHNVAEVEGIIT